jgi:glycine cleavage system aminomethyltransferase T
MDSNFTARLPHPFYGDHVLYHAYNLRPSLPALRAWEFGGWQAESMSWKTGCYIHAGLSSTGPVSIKGPEAKKYLQSIVINSLANFPIGSMKHGVMCTEDGLTVAHGIIERKGENHFESFAGGPPGANPNTEVPFDAEIRKLDHYLFQIAGPTSLQVLEKVTGESLRDIRFLHFRDSHINGVKTQVGRIGMTGNLAYELHGPIEDGPAIYDAVYRAGQEYGIEPPGLGNLPCQSRRGWLSPEHMDIYLCRCRRAMARDEEVLASLGLRRSGQHAGSHPYTCRSEMAQHGQVRP